MVDAESGARRRVPNLQWKTEYALVGAVVLAVTGVCVLIVVASKALAIQAPPLRAAVETTLTLMALSAAWLLRGHFAESRHARDLLLLGAALTLALMTLAFGAVPAALDLVPNDHVVLAYLWAEVVLGAWFIAAAGARADRLVVGPRHPMAIVAGTAAVGVAAAGLAGLLLRAHVLNGMTYALPKLLGVGAAPLPVVQVLVATALLAGSAVAFLRCRATESSTRPALLGVAAILLAAASAYHLVTHALTPRQLTPSELMRLLAFGLILIAAVERERGARARMVRTATLAERNRVARDLHDGIAQDLAFIAAHAGVFGADGPGEHPVATAARRALAVSRGAIVDLSASSDLPMRDALDIVAYELRDRFKVVILIDAKGDREPPPEQREELARMAREAIANAARHGHATRVIVSVGPSATGWTMSVTDDGLGLGGAMAASGGYGFGLISMRERAAALGGRLTLREPPGGGTELEVVFP